MTARRSRGDGGLSWDSTRQRWIASLTVGHTPQGKRIVKRGSGKTKTEAQRKLREIIRDYEDGQITSGNGYTVAHAVRDWLQFGLSGRREDTITKCMILASTHVIPALGPRKLHELSADDVDRWLADKARTLSTSTLADPSFDPQAVDHPCAGPGQGEAQCRSSLRRPPQGQQGRPSKSLTFDQADALLTAAESTPLHAYLVVSLLTGARTEELRALTWSHVELSTAMPPTLMVWRSVPGRRRHQDRKSRRTLELSQRCADALRLHRGTSRSDLEASGGQVARQRPGVCLAHWHCARRGQRSPVLPYGRHRCGSRCR